MSHQDDDLGALTVVSSRSPAAVRLALSVNPVCEHRGRIMITGTLMFKVTADSWSEDAAQSEKQTSTLSG